MPADSGGTVAASALGTPPPKVDEVKRLEKAYELAKELFGYSENVIRAMDEKSRNSVSVASALAAFAVLIRKPAELNAITAQTLWSLGTLVVLVGTVYILHFLIVRPQTAKGVSPSELMHQEETTTYPEEMLFYNFSALTMIYDHNLKTIDGKGRLVAWQNAMLGLTLMSGLLYIAFSASPIPASKQTSTLPCSAHTEQLHASHETSRSQSSHSSDTACNAAMMTIQPLVIKDATP